jgi:hypothetical protein
MKKLHNKVLFGSLILFSGLISTVTFASLPNSGAVSVASMAAYWAIDSGTQVYRYTFLGPLNDGCGVVGNEYAISGDENLNKILHTAYVMGQKVKVGITTRHNGDRCVITFVETVAAD